ncbi:hypothetical protein [Methylotuvimicrobium buryatense]|uniref:hypothetical protein n=1 Tax=Methylotuvimicrobium buryatense TaxID=95641 RepID=UPI00158609E1|nr:hypothetical protein [Methylotuvimicrobium buryatense]
MHQAVTGPLNKFIKHKTYHIAKTPIFIQYQLRTKKFSETNDLFMRQDCALKAAIPNLEIKKGVGYTWRGCRQQGRKMLLYFLHSLHPCNSAIAEEQKSALPPTPAGLATAPSSEPVFSLPSFVYRKIR